MSVIKECRSPGKSIFNLELKMDEFLYKTIALLSRVRLDLTNEASLKRSMVKLFDNNGLDFKPEYILDEQNRPDFFLKGIVIEVKIKGSAMDIYRQCQRYCQFDEVEILILATNRPIGFPKEINGKPCYVINLGKSWL